MHGRAFDVPVPGMSQAEQLELMRAARNSGFTGFGVYGNSLHFDVGPPRAWGPSYGRDSLPAWAAPTIDEILSGAKSPVPPSRGPSGGLGLGGLVSGAFTDTQSPLLTALMSGAMAQPQPQQQQQPMPQPQPAPEPRRGTFYGEPPDRRASAPGREYQSRLLALLMSAR